MHQSSMCPGTISTSNPSETTNTLPSPTRHSGLALNASDRSSDTMQDTRDTSTTSAAHCSPSRENFSSSTITDPQVAALHSSDGFLRIYLGEYMAMLDGDSLECYRRAMPYPPINIDTLIELNMSSILNNARLRHDINFDRELHFRPNTDTVRSRQKAQETAEFWTALVVEFFVLRRHFTEEAQRCNSSTTPINDTFTYQQLPCKRLPRVFEAIRDILKTLVPIEDQEIVTERFDIDHIMQQIILGTCDFAELARWLCSMMKCHCAPMRDSTADKMQAQVEIGARENDLFKLVEGMRQVMRILELMRLDVANHQIRSIRALLIEGTIIFQRKYHAHRIRIGKLNVNECKSWFRNVKQQIAYREIPGFTSVDCLVWGIIQDLLFEDRGNIGPPSFYLDYDRLRHYSAELRNEPYQDVCKKLLHEIIDTNVSDEDYNQAVSTLYTNLYSMIGRMGDFPANKDVIATEMMRVTLVAEGHHTDYNADLLAIIERKLHEEMNVRSHAYRLSAEPLEVRVIQKVRDRVQECMAMSELDLQKLLLPGFHFDAIPMGPGASLEPAPRSYVDPDAEFVDRLTHTIVLHWQVWAELVYLTEEDQGKSMDIDSCMDDASKANEARDPPTRPWAQAEYAPGHKFLPISVKIIDVPDHNYDAEDSSQ